MTVQNTQAKATQTIVNEATFKLSDDMTFAISVVAKMLKGEEVAGYFNCWEDGGVSPKPTDESLIKLYQLHEGYQAEGGRHELLYDSQFWFNMDLQDSEDSQYMNSLSFSLPLYKPEGHVHSFHSEPTELLAGLPMAFYQGVEQFCQLNELRKWDYPFVLGLVTREIFRNYFATEILENINDAQEFDEN